MRRNLLFVLLAFALVLPSFSAFANTFNFSKSKVKLDVPAGWETESKDGQLTMTSVDSKVVLVVSEFEVDNFKLAEKAMRLGLGESGAKNIKFIEDVVENGLKGKNYSAVSLIDGKKMQSFVALYKSPVPARFMMVYIIFLGEPSPKVGKELTAMQFVPIK